MVYSIHAQGLVQVDHMHPYLNVFSNAIDLEKF